MRSAAAVVLVVLGMLAGTWAVALFVVLTRSPDSDCATGALYGGPFVLAGLVAVAAGVRLLRHRR